MAESRTTVDWERIEAQYCAGTMSLREIAAAHDNKISEGAIRKRAKVHGWERDLTAKIRAKAEALLRAETVRAETRNGTAENLTPTEKETIEVEAQVQARIQISHRTDIGRSKRIANKLLEQLEAVGLPSAPVDNDGDATRLTKRAALTTALKEQSSILDKLVGTQQRLVAMEREAYGIAQMADQDQDDPLKNGPGDRDLLEDARRVAFLLSRASHALKEEG